MENTPKLNYTSIINVAVIAVIVAALSILFLTRVDKVIKNNAVDNCAKNSLYSKTTNNEKVAAPLENLYKSCLKDKGY